MPYQQITYEKTDAVARVTMNRPRYRNALSSVLLKELDDAFAEAVADDDVRVIILAGAGDHFSAGHDLGTPEEREGWKQVIRAGVPEQFKWSSDLYLDQSLRLRDVPKPTIAQVQGYCIFGAWIMASAMDMIVAADDGLFLASHFQYFSVPWDLGIRKTKELLFRNRFLRAQEAFELGLVNRVVPRERLEAETTALAEEIAQNDPFGMRIVKLSVNQAQDAMGFRTAVINAHARYMLLEIAGRVQSASDREAGARVLPNVARALEKLRRERAEGDTPNP
ncbi:MAG TPA: enoyl-CoA hydratase-related protein [Dehalococcoidia bacterium]|nr:enoyl-CoA hydratase-related protein [Dehalococcoidia bacterium]